MPKISVVLPVYNGEKYLKKSIESIINQTYKDWELIIVNDCSSDNTSLIAETYSKCDSRIKLINNEINKKLPASLNIGFREAKGEYCTWTSDDNEYYPLAFERMITFLKKNPDYGLVYAQTNVEKNGILQDYLWCTEKTTPELLLKISVPGACFLYKSDIAKIVGEYNEKMFLNEDHEYWLRLFLETKFGNINETLYLYRLRKGSLTGTKQMEIKRGKLDLLRKFRKIYSKIFPEVLNSLKDEILFDKYITGELNFQEVKKYISAKKLYKLLKLEFILNKNYTYLEDISHLGFIYFFKAVKLRYKYGAEKS